MAHKLLNLLAVASLAILACSLGAKPVNAVSTTHQVRSVFRGHDAIAKRKRSVNGKRCKTRPTSSAAATPTSSTPISTPSSSPDSSSGSSDSSSQSSDSSSGPSSVFSSSSSPTSTGASATSTSSGTYYSGSIGGAKGGLAWPNGVQPYLGDYKTDRTNVIYTWSEVAPSNAAGLGFTFVPQLWGSTNQDAFASTVVEGYAQYALFLNEPNEPGQSNIDPVTAAALWKQYMEPLRSQGYLVGSAATSSNPNGMTWMQDFLSACDGGCNWDFTVIHWYDVSLESFQDYVTLWYTTFQKPIWITEFAYQNFNGGPQGDLPTIQSFMSSATAWLDEQSYVEQYFWFGAMLNLQGVNPLCSLMNPDGSPTDLGYQFLYSG